MGDRNLSVIYVFGPRLQGFFRFSIDLQAGFLVVNSTSDADGTRSVRHRRGHERADVRARTCARRSATPTSRRDRERAALVGVRRVRGAPRASGRVFLAGDAAPRDAADRRLRREHAACRTATTSPGSSRTCSTVAPASALLDTYDTERQPVGAFTTEQAYTRYVLAARPVARQGGPDADRRRGGSRDRLPATARTPSRSSAATTTVWEDPRAPTGRPGFRAPHLEVAVDGTRRSTLDLFGRGFVVVAGSDGEQWPAAARAAGEANRHRRRDVSRRRRARGRRRRRRGALRHRHGRRGAHPAGRFRRLAHECGRSRRASTRARRGTRPLNGPGPVDHRQHDAPITSILRSRD